MSSENLSITNTDEYQIIMSPLLSNRFDKLESKIETLITKSEQIDSKYTTILQMLSENKQQSTNKKNHFILTIYLTNK